MAPVLAVVWILAAVPTGPAVREVAVVALLSVGVLAVAAQVRGAQPGRSWLRLALERAPSHAMNLLALLLMIILSGAIGATLGGMVGEALGAPTELTATAGAGLAAFPVLRWYWPLAALAVIAPEETGGRTRALPWLWRGPGYTSARRLACDFGRSGHSALMIAMAYLWLALLLALDSYRGEAPVPLIVEAASYAVFLPLLSWMATVETQRVVSRALTPPP